MRELLNGRISPRDYGTLVQTEWERQKRASALPTQRR